MAELKGYEDNNRSRTFSIYRLSKSRKNGVGNWNIGPRFNRQTWRNLTFPAHHPNEPPRELGSRSWFHHNYVIECITNARQCFDGVFIEPTRSNSLGIGDVMQIIQLKVDSLMAKARAEQKVLKSNRKILNIVKTSQDCCIQLYGTTDNYSKSYSSLIMNIAQQEESYSRYKRTTFMGLVCLQMSIDQLISSDIYRTSAATVSARFPLIQECYPRDSIQRNTTI